MINKTWIIAGTAAATMIGALVLTGAVQADSRSYGMGFGMGGGQHDGHRGGMRGMGMAHLFTLADTNQDGKLSAEEINNFRDAKFAAYDANKDGKLSLDEFEGLLAELTRPMTVRAFQRLDPNGDAAISKEELDQRISFMFNRMDRNNDGELSRDDRRRGKSDARQWRHRHDGKCMQDDDSDDN